MPGNHHESPPHKAVHAAFKFLGPEKKLPLAGANQNWWQLACIQIAGGNGGFPALIMGAALSQLFGVFSAILCIVLGNLVLWIASLAMVTMADRQRINTLENAHNYYGYLGGLLVGLALLVAGVTWYSIEIRTATTAILRVFEIDSSSNQGLFIRIGLGLGLFAMFCALNGIRSIKWVTVVTMPVVLAYFIYTIFFTGDLVQETVGKPLSLLGVPSVIAIWLGGVADYPTFFRHSRSRRDSFIALALILIFSILAQIAGVFMGGYLRYSSSGLLDFNHIYDFPSFGAVLFLAYIVCLVAGLNAANIYSSSIGYEALIPRKLSGVFIGKKEYAILGLAATLFFAFGQTETFIRSLNESTDIMIGSMGGVLIVAYVIGLVKNKAQHRHSDRLIYFLCWLFGMGVGFLSQAGVIFSAQSSLLVAVVLSLALLALITVVREVVGSVGFRR